MELYSTDVRDVKSPAGSLRAEQAAVTRRRIADAALALFAAKGYAATTLREVAAEAGVAVQTVYAVFGSKSSILRVLRERLVHDPAADAAFAAAVAEADAGTALALFAHSIRLRWETGHDIRPVHADAAAADTSLRNDVDAVLGARRRGIGELARSLAQARPTIDPSRAAAVIDALTLPEVYAELVRIHDWSADAYEAWLAAMLQRAVLAAGDEPP